MYLLSLLLIINTRVLFIVLLFTPRGISLPKLAYNISMISEIPFFHAFESFQMRFETVKSSQMFQ